jgi:hypothetical protein
MYVLVEKFHGASSIFHLKFKTLSAFFFFEIVFEEDTGNKIQECYTFR